MRINSIYNSGCEETFEIDKYGIQNNKKIKKINFIHEEHAKHIYKHCLWIMVFIAYWLYI